MKTEFLPITLKEAEQQGIEEFDVIIVSADAYVDHPAFAAALIGRYLQDLGLSVGIIPQPDPDKPEQFQALGRPRLFFGVTAGNLDSMVSLYTAQRKIRSEDLYSEKGSGFKRPYLPTIVYTNRLKQLFKGVSIVVGGIEASLRRIAYYDYYKDKVRPSILLDSKASLLVYGNGEAPLKELVLRMKQGEKIEDIKDIRGTVAVTSGNDIKASGKCLILPSFEDVRDDKIKFAEMTKKVYLNSNPLNAVSMYQGSANRTILINPPAFPLDTKELDGIYSLPFIRRPHPVYKKEIPAFEITRYSLTTHRGCYVGCSFCALFPHQGKFIQSRSRASLLKEAEAIAHIEQKNIVIKDAGGPTANMYGTFCVSEKEKNVCRRRSCLFPEICANLSTSSKDYEKLLDALANSENVKSVFINTGIRYDLALENPSFIEKLADKYTMGHLSAAPEHCSEKVLEIMGKPTAKKYLKFVELFKKLSLKYNKKQYVMPYFIVGHPGDDDSSEQELVEFMRKNRISVEQVQEFYPVPLAVSTAIYYTGLDPFSGKDIFSQKKTSAKKKWKDKFAVKPGNNKTPFRS